jgi:hypothetical protein
MDYRCPKHDLVFEATSDSRKPGALAMDTLPAHPANGHPNCPLCVEDAKGPKSQAELKSEASARAAAAKARADKAAAEARDAEAAAAAIADAPLPPVAVKTAQPETRKIG